MVFFNLSTIQQLNQNYPNFAQTTLGKRPFVLLVYASWCGHCQHMASDWDDAVKEHEKTSDIAQVEHTVFQHLVDTHKDNLLSQIMQEGVKGFPFIATVGPMKSTGKIDVTESDQQRDKLGFDKIMKKIKTPVKSKTPVETHVTPKAPKAAAKAKVAPKPKAKVAPKPKVKVAPKAKASKPKAKAPKKP